MSYQLIVEELEGGAVESSVPVLQKFFKTGKGQYGEGDVFIGVKVPYQRSVAKKYFVKTSLEDVRMLLTSPIHEHRLTALIILTLKYSKAKDIGGEKEIFDLYIEHIPYINNWDLVDTSTHKIVGPYVHRTDDFDFLFRLSEDSNMWAKRIAVVSLWYLWKHKFIHEGLSLILMNLEHQHDLMHKANGWMLRELGKIDEDEMLKFILTHYEKMPRTTLRYAIEKIREPLRTDILKGRV